MIWNSLSNALNYLNTPFFSIQSSGKSCVYLTFDDGPNSNTQKLFSFLDEHNISATHFWLFSQTEKAGTEFEFGIQKIAVHGWNHVRYSKLSKKEVLAEFQKIQSVLDEKRIPVDKYFRSPYGSYKPGLSSICKKFNFRLIFWSHLFEDYLHDFNPETIRKESSYLRAGSIVVMHDKENHYDRICETVLLLQSELLKRNLHLTCLPS